MLEIKEFRKVVIEKLKKDLGVEYDIKEQDVVKINHVEKFGICVSNGQSDLMPVIYIEEFYDRYINGESMEDIIDVFKKIIDESGEQEFLAENFQNMLCWEKVKNQLKAKVVNTQRNIEMLKKMPHVVLADLSIVFHVELAQTQNGIASIQINNLLMKQLGVDSNTLYQQAVDNMEEEYTLRSLSGIITGEDETEDGMWVLSNKSCICGAVEIVCDKVKNDLVDKFGNRNLYILPSSIHELILVPISDKFEPEMLLEMVVQINATEVEDKDFLADSVYIFDAETKEISIAARRKEDE